MRWLTPDALDREKFRWTRWRPQKGGFDNALWVRLQETWRTEVEPWAQPWRVVVTAETSNGGQA